MNSDSARLEVGALSETGYVRDENQDRMSWSPVPLGQLYIVADGMGGHNGGALAAETAVQELQRHISQAPVGEPVDQVIHAAFKKANETVYAKAHSGDPATEGMGTTAVLLLISGQVANLAHVGDSRAYLYRNGRLSQLTTDHTVVRRMVQAGLLKPEEAADHPDASVLERAIGSKPDIEVDIRNELLREGDAILLCSDGLSGYVADAQIESVLRSPGTVRETAENLVKLTLEKGGKDNVTVQLVQYGTKKEAPAARPTIAVKPIPRPTAPLRSFPASRERAPRRTLAAFVIAGIVAAGFFVLYFWNTIKTAEFDATKGIVTKLQKELDDANAAKEKAVKEIAELKGQLAEAGQSAKTTIGKLQKDLQDANVAKQRALKDGDELKGQLAGVKQSAKATTDKIQKQLQAADAAKEKALTEAKVLRQQLDGKDLELQEARKQIQNLTKANKVSPAPQETTPAKGPTGTAPAAGAKEGS
jgi:serine/threonine protein phosphatase PrpC